MGYLIKIQRCLYFGDGDTFSSDEYFYVPSSVDLKRLVDHIEEQCDDLTTCQITVFREIEY